MKRFLGITLLISLFANCKDTTLKKSVTKAVNEQKKVTIEEVENETDSMNQDSTAVWIGKYYFESTNRDNLKTIFEIQIKAIDSISLKYSSDGDKPELYKNIVGELISDDKLKINFNMKYDEMGIVFLEKYGNEFTISGAPIYFINPGSDNLIIKKID